MIRVNVQRAIRVLQEEGERLGRRNLNKAISRALNESILAGRTQARSSVKSLYNIPQRYLGGINVIKSTSVSLVAKLYASSTPIPMDAFSPKFQTSTMSITISRRGEQRTRTRQRARKNIAAGVSIEIRKGNKETIPYAFMIQGGKPRVFARGEYKNGTSFGFVQRNKRVNKSGADIPVKPLLSVTVHAAVINQRSIGQIQQKVNAVFPVSIQRNIAYMLSSVSAEI